jgi:hypothetical protein
MLKLAQRSFKNCGESFVFPAGTVGRTPEYGPCCVPDGFKFVPASGPKLRRAAERVLPRAPINGRRGTDLGEAA